MNFNYWSIKQSISLIPHRIQKKLGQLILIKVKKNVVSPYLTLTKIKLGYLLTAVMLTPTPQVTSLENIPTVPRKRQMDWESLEINSATSSNSGPKITSVASIKDRRKIGEFRKLSRFRTELILNILQFLHSNE